MADAGTPHSSRRVLRVGRCAIGLVLLGLVTTVAVAGLAGSFPGKLERVFSTQAIQRSRGDAFGATYYNAVVSIKAGEVGEDRIVANLRRRMLTERYAPLGFDPSIHISPASLEYPCTLFGTSWGVPFRSFIGWHTDHFTSVVAEGDLRSVIAPESARRGAAIIPYSPLYRGLVLNVAFYAVIWFGVFSLLGAARRSLRRRRGQCPACAYDLRATPSAAPCPECGALH